jgi:hypothetical protein
MRMRRSKQKQEKLDQLGELLRSAFDEDEHASKGITDLIARLDALPTRLIRIKLKTD